MMTIEPVYFLSIFASAFGCTLFYVYLSAKVRLIEYLKSLFGTLAIGVIAFTVSQNYYPANSEMVNAVVIPFFSGFTMPSTLRAYATMLHKFSQKPTEQLTMFAKLYSVIKGNKSKDKPKSEDDIK